MEILKKEKQESSLVVGIFTDEKPNIASEIDEEVAKLIEEKIFSTKLGKVNKFYPLGKIKNKVVFIIGLGNKKDYNYKRLEKAARGITKSLSSDLVIDAESFTGNLELKEVLKRLLLTVHYYDYSFDEYKKKKNNKDLTVSFRLKENQDKIIEEFNNLAVAIKNTGDLVNRPYNDLNAEDLALYATELAKALDSDKVSLNILDKKAIEALEMNAFLAVNKGSSVEPRLIHLKYQGKEDFKDPIALVGKGVMYDTGGYSIKSKMNNMKSDMAGAATALGVFEAVVKNNLPINLQVVIAATDNRISSDALLPDDIVTAMNGKTIEIVSTDAEGRLTLADALTYAQKEGSKRLIDIATLTGAVIVALGGYTTGIFGNNKNMTIDLINSGCYENEHLWELPITRYIRKKVKGSKVADLTNSTGGEAGASSAAAFLSEFVEEGSNWVHLDIAGTAFHTSPSYKEHYGASGVMVRTLYQYLKTK